MFISHEEGLHFAPQGQRHVPHGPPAEYGIMFGLVLALPFWCCFAALVWALI